MKVFGKGMIAAALPAAFIFMLSGCVHATVRMEINENGSVDAGYEVLAQDSMLSTMGNADELWGNMISAAQADGASAEKLSSKDGYSGVRATTHFASVDEMNVDNDLLGGAEGAMQGVAQDGSPLFRFSGSAREKTTFFGTTYDIAINADFSGAIKQLLAKGGQGEKARAAMKAMLDEARFSFELTVPARASGNNATSVTADGLTYKWKMDLGKPNEIRLTATVPDMNNILFAVFGAAAAALIVTAVLLLAASASRKRKSKRVETW